MFQRTSEPDLLRCSFCNKEQTDVKKLIAGPTVFICDECVAVCNDILADDGRFDSEPKAPQSRPALEDTVADVVPCGLCSMALAIDDAVAVPERGFLCAGCVDAIEAALATSREEGA